MRISTPVPGLSPWIARTVSAYSQAPSSSRSSRATPVTVAYRSPIACTDSPTRRGSSWSRVGPAGVDLAEVAAAGAVVAADEEGCLAVFPALEDVRAAGLLAHGVQAFPLDQSWSSWYSGPIRAVVLIHAGFFSMGVSLLRTSRRSSRRPSAATLTASAYPRTGAGRRHRDGQGEQAWRVRSTTGRVSVTVTGRPSSADSDVTPASEMPHGMIRENQARSQSQLIANPCMLTRRWPRRPMAATFRSGLPVVGRQPDAAAGHLDSAGVDLELGAHVDEHLLDSADEGHHVDRLGKPHDRIADDLTGAVPR